MRRCKARELVADPKEERVQQPGSFLGHLKPLSTDEGLQVEAQFPRILLLGSSVYRERFAAGCFYHCFSEVLFPILETLDIVVRYA
jgi:hypothetical protein